MIKNNTSERITNVKGFIIFFYIECCFFFKNLEMFFRLKFFYRLQENNAYDHIYLIDKPQIVNTVEITKTHVLETAPSRATLNSTGQNRHKASKEPPSAPSFSQFRLKHCIRTELVIQCLQLC